MWHKCDCGLERGMIFKLTDEMDEKLWIAKLANLADQLKVGGPANLVIWMQS